MVKAATFSLLVMFLAASGFAQCGVERWSIKTGTDAGAPSINLSTYTSNTIYNFHQSTRPASLPSNSRVAPRETTQYRVTGTLIGYKRESDSDYHLVIQDGSGRTMIVEIPSLNCVGGGSPFASRIGTARSQFDAKLTATTSYKTVTAPVAIKGIGFWDFLHGQTGVAPNGIEVHPALDIQFTGTITAGGIGAIAGDGQAPPAATMPADMVEDNDGGRAHVFRGGDPIANILFHGGSVIERPRMQFVFVGDRWYSPAKQSILQIGRGLSSDARFAELAKYGVVTSGMAVDGLQLDRPFARGLNSMSLRTVDVAPGGTDLTDLDVQRLLADAVDEGRLQPDPEQIVVVVLDEKTDVAVGTTRDWSSYHSLFHPTDQAMPYVVVRNVADSGNLREALFASVARAIVNPAGDAWS
jgi:hypothetical protein